MTFALNEHRFDKFLSVSRYLTFKMLHEILLSLWGCSTSVSQIIETDVSAYILYILTRNNI